MILLAWLDPVPLPGPFLALPEPSRAFQVVHAKVDRRDSVAPMPGGGSDENYGITGVEFSDAVKHGQTHGVEPRLGPVGELHHAGKCQRLVM